MTQKSRADSKQSKPKRKAAPGKARSTPSGTTNTKTRGKRALKEKPTDFPEGQGLNGPDQDLMRFQTGIWNTIMDRYFRLEIEGFDKVPEEPCLLIGVHSGGPLTMDAWTVVLSWWRHFGPERILHGTAHDVLMKAPVLSDYFLRTGGITPTKANILAAFEQGDSVILWPGGADDSFRAWKDRDRAVLAGRKGFIRLAMTAGVPIVPVATVGGHDTLFVLSEGRGLAKFLGLHELLRSDVLPLTLSWPLGVLPHLTPFQHIPLPAKIRTELMAPIYLETSQKYLNDQEYVDSMYTEVVSTIQSGMDKLASRRSFPLFG